MGNGKMDFQIRVKLLEKRLKQLQMALAICLLFIVSAFLLGATVPRDRVVEAEKFVLNDKKGKARAEPWVSAIGPRLTFYRGNGITSESIVADFVGGEKGGALYLYSQPHKSEAKRS